MFHALIAQAYKQLLSKTPAYFPKPITHYFNSSRSISSTVLTAELAWIGNLEDSEGLIYGTPRRMKVYYLTKLCYYILDLL